MKPTATETLEVISPHVQISESYIETDYAYQTSNVKRLANGKIQVSIFSDLSFYLIMKIPFPTIISLFEWCNT